MHECLVLNVKLGSIKTESRDLEENLTRSTGLSANIPSQLNMRLLGRRSSTAGYQLKSHSTCVALRKVSDTFSYSN